MERGSMNCHQCGEPIGVDGRFCKMCGAKVKPTIESEKLYERVEQINEQKEEVNKQDQQEVVHEKAEAWLKLNNNQENTEHGEGGLVQPLASKQDEAERRGISDDVQQGNTEASADLKEDSAREMEFSQDEIAAHEEDTDLAEMVENRNSVDQENETKENDSTDQPHNTPPDELQSQLDERVNSAQNTAINDEVSNHQQVIATEQSINEDTLTRAAVKEDKKQKPKGRFLAWFIPIFVLLAVGVGVTGFYFHEVSKNDLVLALKTEAEAKAFDRNYEEAITLIQEAIALRPQYSVLTEMLNEVHAVIDFSDDLNQLNELLDTQQYQAAQAELLALNGTLAEQTGPLFHSFAPELEAIDMTITVGMIKEELDDLHTITQLHDKLQMIESLPAAEGEEVKKQILTKIVKLTMDDAIIKLDDKQFYEALMIVEHGLEYVPNDDKLLSLKERIEQEKFAFEQAEQERIEQALEAAAREDLKNRTEAVEVTFFEYSINDFGDLYIYGDVKNVATRPISSITIYYSVYDVNGFYIDSGTAYVYPYLLAPGGEGMFDDVFYFVYEDVTVEIDNITWYVE